MSNSKKPKKAKPTAPNGKHYKKNLQFAHEIKDCVDSEADYGHKLSAEELQFLRQFNQEFYKGDGRYLEGALHDSENDEHWKDNNLRLNGAQRDVTKVCKSKAEAQVKIKARGPNSMTDADYPRATWEDIYGAKGSDED